MTGYITSLSMSCKFIESIHKMFVREWCSSHYVQMWNNDWYDNCWWIATCSGMVVKNLSYKALR